MREEVERAAGGLRYARVQMSLLEVLGGGFFNHYVKTGKFSPTSMLWFFVLFFSPTATG